MKFKIAFIQFPLNHPNQYYENANIPLAGAYLKTSLLDHFSMDQEQIQIIPSKIVDYGSDQAVLYWIQQNGFDLIGFSVYLWNLQRTELFIHLLKQKMRNVKVICGGPEIIKGQKILENKDIDAFVIGEGESLIINVVDDYQKKRLKREYISAGEVNLQKLKNPYIEGNLEYVPHQSLYFETMRGCPYQCTYCFYGKMFSHLRYFNQNNLQNIFLFANSHNVSEIYFMDPSFNITPDLSKILKEIKKFNIKKIPIHTEIRLESINSQIATLMKESGFVSVEVGLQSINQEALKNVKRTFNLEKFIQGANYLKKAGIAIKTGVIIGLPGDTLHDFKKTIEFLIDLELHHDMEIYFLSVLPGTQLREDASNLNIRYMKNPPYWVLSTPDFSESELFEAIHYLENRLFIDYFNPILPRFNKSDHWLDYLKIDHNFETEISMIKSNCHHLAEIVTLHIIEFNSHIFQTILQFGKWLKNKNPSMIVLIVFDLSDMPDLQVIRELNEVFFLPEHFFNFLNYYKLDNQNLYSVRYFYLCRSVGQYKKFFIEDLFFDPILLFKEDYLKDSFELIKDHPMLLVEQELSNSRKKQLMTIYESFEDLLIFNY